MEAIRTDLLTPTLAARFAATLDRAPAKSAAPQGIHWCLAVPEAATADLGADGHPLPDIAVPPRRMWVASDVRFLAPLPIGATIERRSRLIDRVEKQGSSGRLLFVTIAHLVRADGALAIEETQTIVYRQAAGVSPAAPLLPAADAASPDASWRRTILPAAPLLFRYSALTFNSHRVHYDLPYARDVEGYRGLIVHGPLIATMLLDLADREIGANRLSRFAFRAISPAFCDEPLRLLGARDGGDLTLEARGPGGTTMTATATIG